MPTESDLHWLRSQWQQLFAPLQVAPQASEQAFAALVKQYASPGRYYHTLDHIRQVIDTINQLRNIASDLTVVLLAGWFHDVIYDPRAKDNEELSADYAREVLERLG